MNYSVPRRIQRFIPLTSNRSSSTSIRTVEWYGHTERLCLCRCSCRFLATACPCLDDLPVRNPTFYRKYSPRDRPNLKRRGNQSPTRILSILHTSLAILPAPPPLLT